MSKRSFQVSIDFLGNISDLQNKIKTLSGDLNKIGGTSGGIQVQKQFDQLSQTLTNLQTKAKQPITSQGEFNKLASEVNKAESAYNNLTSQIERLYGMSDGKKLELLPKDEQKRIKDAANAIKIYENAAKGAAAKLNEFKNIQDKATSASSKMSGAEESWKRLEAQYKASSNKLKTLEAVSRSVETAQTNLNKAISSNASEEEIAQLTKQFELAKNAASQLRVEFQEGISPVDSVKAAVSTLKREVTNLGNQRTSYFDKFKTAKADAEALNAKVKELNTEMGASGQTKELEASFERLKLKATELGISLKGIDDISSVSTLIQRFKELETSGIIKAEGRIQSLATKVESELNPALVRLREETNKNTESSNAFFRAMNDVDGLKSRIGYFFSMTNSVMLLRRALTSALNTVKELDAVMTETAVVTDFTVGDMWEKLPEYASHANALGASIKDLYSATTLYYQQGLQTEAAMGVGIETMKMARIAGMEAADATEAMTAALRGFNMEVNETNAVRVNDVYSELAAITAADTEQIATAMSKTASIAASANMEFETTAALLAQIIETTQEAPETAGTALKTIIARFSEVKKLREEGANTGEDEEGEAIDVNKIQGALRTVGISMDDFFAGAEGLDSILLKLAEKWKDLDFETQRYIATTAAGSRQQSRFIAMMSDYERTMELATAANNSAGASQQQFDKTLESMEAKLQKLKNAWNEFTMGLANNEILKFGVDVLTGLLNTVNKLTSSLSGGNGLVKSVVNLATAIAALKGGAMIMGKLLGETQINVTGKKGNIFSLGKTNAVQQIIGNNTQQQGYIEGQKAGQGFTQGFRESIQNKTMVGNITQASSGFFGQSYFLNDNKTDYLAQAYDLNQQNLDFDINKVVRAYDTGGIEAANNAIKEMGGTIEGIQLPIKTTQINFTNLGMAAMGVGTAVTLLGSLFEKMGMEEFGEKVKKAGSVFTGLGTTVMMLGPLLNKTGLSVSKLGLSFVKAGAVGAGAGTATTIAWGPFLGIILPIVAALALLVGAFIAIRNASPEVQLQKAQEAAAQAAEAANEAAEAYNNLKSSLESIEEKETILEELTIGTQEWKNAVQELNNQILDLIELYPQLAEFISYNESGILTISEEGKNLALDKHLQRQQNTQTAKIGANINELIAQQNLDYSELDSNLKIVIEEKIESSNYENNNTISSEFKKRQQEILDSQTPHYGSESAFLEQNTVKNYDKEETEALARAIASGDWKGREEQIATITGTSDPKEFVNTEEYKELRNFGQALIESDAAIKIFTDSLENAAILNADVSEEYKDKISGIYDTESIENMLTKEKENIDLSENREYWEKEYAKTMNYQYENGKFYSGEGENKKEVTLLDQDIKSQLAAINVQKAMTDNLSKVSNELENLHNSGIKLGQSFINMASKADGAGLTLADLDNLEGALNEDLIKRDENGKITQWSQELADLYTEVGHLYSSPEEFYRIISEAYSQAQLTREQSEVKMESMGLTSNAFNQANIDTGTLGNIVNEIYKVFLTSGKQTATELNNTLGAIMTELGPDQAQIFADALSLIDWSNIDSVEELSKILNELGFDSETAGVDIEALEKQIIEAAKATKIFNLDKIKEEIGNIEDLVKDLEDREDTERTFTKEERDLMIGADPSLTGQFVATGIDEFVYVGNSIETLITALDANTAALLSEYGEQVMHNAEMSDKWQNLADNGAMWTNGQNEYQVLSSIAQSGSLEGYNIEGVIGIMEKAGMGVDSGRSLGGYTPSQLAEIIMADYNQYGSELARNENATALNDYNTNLGQIAYQDQQKTDRQLLEDSQGSGQNQQYAANQIAAEAVGYSEVSDELAKYNELLDENGKLKDESQKATYDTALKEMKFATELAKAKKEMQEYGKEVDESLDSLEDMEEGTEEYKDALDDMAKQTNKYLDSDIDGAFLEQGNNLELLEDALEGDADAWEQFNKNVMSATAKAMADNNQMGENFVNTAANIAKITSALDALEFDVNGTADVSQLINEFLAAGGTASEVAAYLEQLGLTNIDLVADVQGLGSLEEYINSTQGADGTYNIPLGSIKATNVRVAPSGFSGFTGGGGRSGGGGGGGGGGGKKEKWENPYDEFYNVVEDINEELRTREKLERRYQALLDKTGTKASDLVKNARDQINSLEKQKKLREGLLEGRTRQMSDIESEYSDLSKYAWYNEQDGTIEIDWEKINALDGSTNEKLTSRIEEYIKKLEEQQDLIEQEEDELEAIEETLREIRDQGKDEYFDFEEQIKDALIDQRQKEIDKLSAINDSINDTNSRLIDAMQSSIDKYRQDRENERTEEELSDKQRRLAYLQQDTSGANALEIMQLQEEIDQGVEDYTDQLIDQKINELQEQNDEAAEQREKQIAIAEAQLKKWEESGEIWNNVYELMGKGMDEDGIIPGSELQNLLKEAANFEGMSELQKMDWLENLENNVAQAIQWLMVGNSSKMLLSTGQIKENQKITFTTRDGQTVTGTVQSDGTIKTDTGEVYKDVYRSFDGKTFYTNEDYITPEEKTEEEATPTETTTQKEIKVGGKINAKGAKIYGYIGGEGHAQYFKDDPIYKVLDEKSGYLKVRWHKQTSGVTGWFKKKDVKAYKQGGLADFTGPAWLDGTKSKPEYILNAEQTKSFFELVDVLGSLKSGTNQSSQITGDSIYDVDINVESIGSDYDVEKLATTIKRMINDDARYRNNNAINLQR